MENLINLKDLAGVESFSSRFARLGDFYILSRIDTSKVSSSKNRKKQSHADNGTILKRPLRLDGMLFILVERSSLSIQVNTETYDVAADDFIVVRPGTLVSIDAAAPQCSLTFLFISSAFLHNINIDLNAIEFGSIMSHPRPAIRLSDVESSVFRKYFDLLDFNAADTGGSILATRIAQTLISGIVYEILRFASSRTIDDPSESRGENIGRAQSYVLRFMQLLHIHYARQRTLEFYADRLCITPKYLSMITKDITGHTASDWINRVVSQEAKNMLLFSDKNIQEIAYALNFPSQSAFGKYFKRLTGVSPTEYIRKTQS